MAKKTSDRRATGVRDAVRRDVKSLGASSQHNASPGGGDDKREAILDAALDLFAERGFYGTAVPLLAQNAKVAAGTIYRYFENKEAIVNALYVRQKELLGRELLHDFPYHSSPRDQFHFFWMRAANFARQNPKAFAFLELHHHQRYLDDECRALEARILSPAYTFFAMGHEKRVTKPFAAEVLGAIVWGALVGLVRAGWEKRLELTDEAIAQAEQCVWEAIRC